MNAEEAARAIGCHSKTVLRHIAKGTITATHKHAQELSITEDQVEKLRLVLASGDKSGQSEDKSLQIEALATRCVELEYRVLTLEHKVQLLESRHVPTQPVPLHPSTPKTHPQNRTTEPPTTLPPDTLSASDFAKLHGIEYENMKNYMRRGVNGEQIDVTEVPHPVRANYTQKYLTVEQQQKALELLRRHGKI